MHGVLPDLPKLRALGIRIANLTQTALSSVANTIPEEMIANEYAPTFAKFPALSFFHLRCAHKRRPKPNLMCEKDFRVEKDVRISRARNVATALPSIDVIG
ncbi:uncharacterized protein LACBIDRAFT_300293 [Laccaria bicolor S238N-H82]|uniref:Predicted protein n=1 Tax=Laccaria bicolor (strain S238N-H82 / ATCC MYA-4686) TaxID=486041 RepID=B0DGF0_LACBS|nr:uncharacterized protein LACBIDRAFT_300293 [Laccaria bicolor S238N-H82]EDR06141.1 predicted protein [Laccaria bicolor S238N-H82]|eukprot:XP_001883002.1 predicted protein [Laccaria bicolor S238N-H82]